MPAADVVTFVPMIRLAISCPFRTCHGRGATPERDVQVCVTSAQEDCAHPLRRFLWFLAGALVIMCPHDLHVAYHPNQAPLLEADLCTTPTI
jgi:hypothetical protein